MAEKKAQLLYETVDAYPEVYKVVPDKSVRSRMNICFRVTKVCYLQNNHVLELKSDLFAGW